MKKKLSLNQMESLQGGKFWGADTDCSVAEIGGGQCMQTCVTEHYAFWIKYDTSQDWDIRPCSTF